MNMTLCMQLDHVTSLCLPHDVPDRHWYSGSIYREVAIQVQDYTQVKRRQTPWNTTSKLMESISPAWWLCDIGLWSGNRPDQFISGTAEAYLTNTIWREWKQKGNCSYILDKQRGSEDVHVQSSMDLTYRNVTPFWWWFLVTFKSSNYKLYYINNLY